MSPLEDCMRAVLAGLTLVVVSSVASAQQPAAPVSAAPSRTMVSAADVAALIAKANAAVHETEAELFYVVDGSAMLVTGGKLKNETRTNAANLSGTGIDGGVSR